MFGSSVDSYLDMEPVQLPLHALLLVDLFVGHSNLSKLSVLCVANPAKVADWPPRPRHCPCPIAHDFSFHVIELVSPSFSPSFPVLIVILFSRGHATLELAVSVGR